MACTAVSEKKKALLILKEKLLKELEYYDKRIKDVPVNNNNNYMDDSSDSDTGLPTLNIGPSKIQLKIQKCKLKTCLQATQELTGLQVLQSEVNVMVEDPVLDRESAVTEVGTWREVTAECRINCLQFTIMFYVHKPSGMFGASSYRGVRVSALKAAHEAELGAGALNASHTPAHAIQALSSYSVAYRSRRTTLASLVERYGDTLYMEPHAEGGLVLKCVDLLEAWWLLENTESTLAPFRHKMKFSFEYMDECYVKIVTHAHRELSKPNLNTEERTFLLAKIISTCLEVRGSAPEVDESMESDTESVVRVEKRQTIHDQDIESNEGNNKGEANIMAPPKYLPKRAKPKGKENTVENGNKGVKRTSSNDGIGGKRAKISEEGNQRAVKSVENTKNTDNIVIGESEGVTITDLVYKIDGVVQNKDKNKKKVGKTNKVTEKNVDEINANNIDKVKKVVKTTSNDQISAKSKVTKDNLNTKDPKGDTVNNKMVNVPKESVTPNQNANANTNDTELNIAGGNNKQKSQENLKENNNIKKTTSNKNTVNQNKNSVPKKGETTLNIAKKPKTVGKIPENTNKGAKNDNAKTNLDNKKGFNNKPENQNVETSKAVNKNNKISKATDNTTDNKNHTNENSKNDLAKKSKPENSNVKTVVTKTKVNRDNAKNNQASNNNMAKKGNNVENGGERTKTTLNKNKEPNIVKKSVASTKDKANTNVASSKNKESNTVQKVTENNVATSKNTDLKKSVASTKDKANTNVASSKNKESNTAQKVTENNVATSKNTEKNTVRKATENNSATNKNKDNIVDVANGNVASLSRESSKDNLNTNKTVQNAIKNKPTLNILNKHNIPKKVAKPGNSGTFFKPGNTGTFLKSNSTGTFLNPSSTEKKDGGKVTSKIPQKCFKTISDNAMKKIPLRVSPRKMASMFKSPSRPILNHKIQKPSTNIPRLLKTSVTKTKC